MTAIQKMFMQEIKKHNAEREGLEMYNKGIKFASMDIYPGRNHITCTDGTILTKYKVSCQYKSAESVKGVIDYVDYQVNIYSNGDMAIYFDGTHWAVA